MQGHIQLYLFKLKLKSQHSYCNPNELLEKPCDFHIMQFFRCFWVDHNFLVWRNCWIGEIGEAFLSRVRKVPEGRCWGIRAHDTIIVNNQEWNGEILRDSYFSLWVSLTARGYYDTSVTCLKHLRRNQEWTHNNMNFKMSKLGSEVYSNYASKFLKF